MKTLSWCSAAALFAGQNDSKLDTKGGSAASGASKRA